MHDDHTGMLKTILNVSAAMLQILELTEAASKEKELKAKVKSLSEQLDDVRNSHTLATSEIQVCMLY